MNPAIKHTQLTRVGYEYQDLFCIQLLIDWYHDKNKYQWIKIESDYADNNKLNSLDDVAARRSDGLYELTQVKFTIDATRTDLALDFVWLTKHAKKGTSLLQKWAKDVLIYGQSNQLALAELKTNRVPDSSFSACLIDDKIDTNKIPSEVLAEIDAQLKGRKNTIYFFDNFSFVHSLPAVDDLENKLHDSLVPDHTNEEGWFRFLHAVKRWATRKGEPSEDGCINFGDIQQILRDGISRDISQYLEIPEGYKPPSIGFHIDLLNKLSGGGTWVVSGSPGMGKSTYLSYLYERLRSTNRPVIRHHYSLQSQSIIDRISYPTAASSLINQLKENFGLELSGMKDEPEYLDQWLTKAGNIAQKNKTNIVVIIDGLDHVWRERSDISQLEHLINKMLPLPDGISLILGSQPISASKLPSRLATHCPPNSSQWLTLPCMDLSAISSWVDGLQIKGEIEFQQYKNEPDKYLAEISEALRKVSSGYPLHLIYSVRSLLKKQKLITAYDIEKLPVCPDGDIHSYYSAIWSQLSSSSKEILYLVAITDFPWPDSNSLQSCLSWGADFLTAYDDIEHLVESRRSGLYPFHGSLIVNIRQKVDFHTAKNRLLPSIRSWLESNAPSYWKWGWEWVVSKDLGDSNSLLNGITRPWLRNALCKGYPIQHIEHIISIAETTAFKEKNYSKLVDLRLIKIRLLNGPEFQVQDFPEFVKSAIVASDDDYGLLWRSDNIKLLGEQEIIALSSMYRKVDSAVIEECYQELYRRILFYANIAQDNDDKFGKLVDAVLKVLCDTEQPDIDRIISFVERITPRESLYIKLFKYLISTNNSSYIFDIDTNTLPTSILNQFGHSLVIASCISEIQIPARIDTFKLEGCSILTCYKAFHSETELDCGSKKIIPCVSHKEISEALLEELYFLTLSSCLSLENVDIDDSLTSSLSAADLYAFQACKAVFESAVKTADKIVNGEKINVLDIYTHLIESGLIRDTGYNYERNDVSRSTLWCLPKIAIKLYLLAYSADKVLLIEDSALGEAKESVWWNPILFFNYLGSLSPNLINKKTSEKYLSECLDEVSNRKDNTAILCNDSLEITSIGRTLELEELTQKGLQLTSKHLVGYGYRKDTTFSEVFESIQACSDACVGDLRGWLSRVSPFTVSMYDFTEREINHIPGWYIKLVAKNWPERLYDELTYHLNNQNWHVLEDILTGFVANADLAEPSSQSLTKCFVASGTIDELKNRAEANAALGELYDNQISFIGGTPLAPRERHSSSSTKDEPINIGYGTHAPTSLALLIQRVNNEGVYSDYDYFTDWINYWDHQGKGVDVITAFEDIFTTEQDFPSNSGLRYALDSIFELSKKLQGKKRAYKWAVRSIRINSYWGRYSGRRADKMIAHYGSIYAADWEQLLSDSAHGEVMKLRGDEWVVVPTSKLSMYLLSANQQELAVEITEVLVQSLENEIEHLPIDPCYWPDRAIDSNQLAFKMLLTYFQWPDRVVRLRCAKEIAGLLENDSAGILRTIYLEHLRGIAYELGVVDFVSILSLMDHIPFDNAELLAAIPHHSLALKILFGRFDYDYDPAYLINTYLPDSSDLYVDDRLKKSMDGIPQIYILWLEALGKKVNHDLVRHMSLELDHIYERKEYLYFSPFNYCGDVFWRTDKIMGSFSTITESAVLSAYLRTLAFSASELSVSNEEIDLRVSHVLPLGKYISSLSQSNKPGNWPKLSSVPTKNKVPTRFALLRVLEKLACSQQIVLGASGSVEHKLSGVCVELEVFAVFLSNVADLSDQEIFEAAALSGSSSSTRVFPLSAKRYPANFGRWEGDKVFRGFFAPQFRFNYGDVERRFKESSLDYCEAELVNSTWRYWHQNWYPIHYYELGPSIGTILEASPEATEFITSQFAEKLYLVAKFTVLDKSGYSSDCRIDDIYLKAEIRPGLWEEPALRVLPSVKEYLNNHKNGGRLPRGNRFSGKSSR